MADEKEDGALSAAELRDQTIKEMGLESETGDSPVDQSAAKGTDVPGPDQQETKPVHLKSGETQDANYDEQTSDPRFPDTTRGAFAGVGSSVAKQANIREDKESHAGGITVMKGIDRSRY